MNSFECTHCTKSFQTKSILNRHILSHLSIKPYQCDVCNKTFTQNSSLVRHQVIHTKEKKFQCPNCDLKFSQKYNVKVHIKRVHSIKRKGAIKHPCSHCSCIFNKLNSLNRHIAEIHSNLIKMNEANNDSFGELIEQLKMLQNNSKNIDINDMYLNTVPEKLLSDSYEEINLTKEIEGNILNSQENKTQNISANKLNRTQNISCPDCGKKFQRKFDLSRHSRIHNKVKPFSCTKCYKSFTLKCTRDRHIETHLKLEKKFQCNICLKKFVTQLKLDKHTAYHFLSKSFKCVLCPKSFKLKQNLATHEKIHQLKDPREEEIRKCLIPPIIITCNPPLDDIYYKYNCSKCSMHFKSLAHLRYHEAKHLGIKNFKCNICERCFLTNSSLTCHQLVHHSIFSFKCQMCAAKFKTTSNLKKHLLVHNNVRKFMCAYCLKTFNRKYNCRIHLNTHIKDILLGSEPHTNDNPSFRELKNSITELVESSPKVVINDACDILKSCTICKKNFKKSHDLERHNRIHNNEKPYRCDKCNKSFRLKGTLQSHMKTHEANRSKICCTVCGKSYATQSALKLHLRLHTGELPFQCDYCPKMFRTAGHKIAHSKQHLKKKK